MAKKAQSNPFDPNTMIELFDPARLMAQFNQNLQNFNTGFSTMDLSALAEIQRKNIEALTEANRSLLEGAEAIARRQNEMFQQAAAEATAFSQQFAEGNVAEMTERQTQLMAQSYSRVVAHMQEASATIRQAQIDALQTLDERWRASLKELFSER